MLSQKKITVQSFLIVALCFVGFGVSVSATEFHVSMTGQDSNAGTQAAPFRTIQHAAEAAQPGDVITVHEGVYRERVNPPRGGESDARRIVYQAGSGEKVEIKGSEPVKNWVKVQDDLWKVTLPNSFFGAFNPYQDLIRGDWFDRRGRDHHTGAVYLNGDWLTEAAKLDDVQKTAGDTPLWFGQVDTENTTLWAQFKGVNPNEQRVEINVRQTVFYPDQPGRNYITVRGFALRHAATPWAPPTAEQIGLIGTHWSKGWIIENNTVSHSICSGIALGKHGDQFDNTSADTAEGYVLTIERAYKEHHWNRDTIGHHLVRNNTISHCEQAGIVGSLGAAFSTVTGNRIHDIHVRQLFSGAEMAGIKFHAAIDTEISDNHIYRTCRGLWLDWMAQGTRVSRNVFHDNGDQDLFVEVNHGPFGVDNNLFLSGRSVLTVSRGGAFVHNLFAGAVQVAPYDGRQTPYLKPHSTEVAALHDNPSGDDRYYNNLFLRQGDLSQYDEPKLPVWMDGNVFVEKAKPCKQEKDPLLKPDFDSALKLAEQADGAYLELQLDKAWATERTRSLVTAERLGKAAIPNLPYENADGSPVRLDTDFFGKKRNVNNPFPGPFERPDGGKLTLKVWAERPVAECPFKPSEAFAGVQFTGRHAEYTGADTWYPSWASDGNLYSPWTDGNVNGLGCSSGGEGAATGFATILGDDPLKLTIANQGTFKSSPRPYEGRYPCGSLVYNGVWYYGTYCLHPSGMVQQNAMPYNWPWLGPIPGFRWSTDFGKTWTETPCTPAKPLFGESALKGEPVKIGAPHFVDFGQNMEHSPDGKAYLVGHGASSGPEGRRYAYNSWITGDEIYLTRVKPSIENMNDVSQYEFYAGPGLFGRATWSHDLTKIQPIAAWKDNMGCVTMTWNAPLKKYFLCVTDGGNTVDTFNTYLLESDRVTGPWKMVSYLKHFGEQAYFVNIPSKFISADGRTMWLCYAANFSVGWGKEKIESRPEGSRYGMCLQEIQLVGR